MTHCTRHVISLHRLWGLILHCWHMAPHSVSSVLILHSLYIHSHYKASRHTADRLSFLTESCHLCQRERSNISALWCFFRFSWDIGFYFVQFVPNIYFNFVNRAKSLLLAKQFYTVISIADIYIYGSCLFLIYECVFKYYCLLLINKNFQLYPIIYFGVENS